MRLLINYTWPGNVRELENTVERAVILAETDVIHTQDLPEKLLNAAPSANVGSGASGVTLEELEREHMRRILKAVKGDKVKAAQVLGIHLSTLYRKVQRYRLENEGQPATIGKAGDAKRLRANIERICAATDNSNGRRRRVN